MRYTEFRDAIAGASVGVIASPTQRSAWVWDQG